MYLLKSYFIPSGRHRKGLIELFYRAILQLKQQLALPYLLMWMQLSSPVILFSKLETGLNDPSLDGCFAGLKKITTISATIGAKAACQCVHAALSIAANPTSVAVGGGVGISAQVTEKCGINLGFSIDATVGC